MKKIILTQGKFALVDDEDFEWINQWKWTVRNGYPSRTIYLGGGRKNQTSEYIYMHRIVNNTPKNSYTDHINRNKLDNRKCNLRTVTNQQNCCNRELQDNNTSGFRGVTWNNQRSKWMAQIKANSKYYYLGLFIDKIDAAKAYDKAAIKFFGNFSNPNL
jgi:hypothetical protein